MVKNKQTPVIFTKIAEAIEQLYNEQQLPIFCSMKLLQQQLTQHLTKTLKKSLLPDLEALNDDDDMWIDLFHVSHLSNSSHLTVSFRTCMIKECY
jgi:hypothetical protein